MSTSENFWRDRRVFVTGCTGLVGSWTVRALLQRGAHVVGLVRDRVCGSEMFRAGLHRCMDVVRGRVESQPRLERAPAEHEIQTVIHLAAQTIVGIANKSPLSTFETSIKGTWCLLEAARSFYPRVRSEPEAEIRGVRPNRGCTAVPAGRRGAPRERSPAPIMSSRSAKIS